MGERATLRFATCSSPRAAGLRELDDVGLTETFRRVSAGESGRSNVQHRLVGLPVYRRLAGYEDPTTLNGCRTTRRCG